MRDEALLYFQSPNEFKSFFDSLNIYNDWKITNGTMNFRGETIRNKSYAIYLRNIFNNKEMFRRSVSISEIVSWLDSFVIINRFFSSLRNKLSIEDYNQIELYCEYVIKMSKKSRVDFILKYKQTIILLEFRMINDFKRIKSTWDKKKLEMLVYKEMLQNYLDNMKVLTFVFVSLYEYEEKNIDQIHVDYNNKQVDFLVEYTIKFVIEKYKNVQNK